MVNRSKETSNFFRWYHLYYILAIFGLVTVCFSLFLNQRIINHYNESIEANHQWTLRLRQLSELGRLAGDVNAPANDVFASKDVKLEKKNLGTSIEKMNDKLKEIQTDFQMSGLLDPHRFRRLALDILKVDRRLGEMTAQATVTMGLFEQGKVDDAGRAMAVMDRRFYCANGALRNMQIHISDIQQNLFERQLQDLQALRNLERLIACSAVFMILGVTAYGQKLAKQMTNDEKQKQEHILQIESANEDIARKNKELEAVLADLQEAQKRIMESERKFQAIFDHTFQLIGLLDTEGRILEANRTSLDFIGVKREDVVGKLFWETPWWTHSPEAQQKLKESVASAAQGQFVRFETTHQSLSGKAVAVDFSLKPVLNELGNVILLIPEGRDISDKKIAEQRVSEFYSTVSHELRTPLTSIHGSLGLIAGGLAGETTEKTQKLVGIARQESERLIRLINDILDLRKIEAGMLELRRTFVQPAHLVERTANNLSGMAHSAEIEITQEIATLPELNCDEDRVLQVLTNLVSNAIKFSQKGDKVKIGCAEGESDRVRFFVNDSGPGIAPENLSKLFVKFQQIDQSDHRQKEGSGLGLAISKALVEQHGGRIDVESVEGKGSTFWFEIPNVQNGDASST